MGENQLSPSSQGQVNIPEKWQEHFLLKRIGEEDIELTLKERNAVIEALGSGSRFVQIRKHTLMINSIKSIDPMWGEDNIPPRPRPKDFNYEWYNRNPENDKEGQEWDKVFGEGDFKKRLTE